MADAVLQTFAQIVAQSKQGCSKLLHLENFLLSDSNVLSSQPETCSISLRKVNDSRLDALWRDYFRGTSTWWDSRTGKTITRSPQFEHKSAKHSLWIHSAHNSCWVQEELRRRRLESPMSSNQIKTAQFLMETNKKSTMVEDRLPESKQGDGRSLSKAKSSSQFQIDNDVLLDDTSQSYLFQRSADVFVNIYAKQGLSERAEEMFDGLPTRGLISWNSLIAGYVQHGRCLKVLHCFQQMHQEGFFPDAITFVCVLKACSIMHAAEEGQHIFAKLVKEGLAQNNRIIGNALLDMYAKCGLLQEAQELFEERSVQDVISWTTLITGYMQNGHEQDALDRYRQMLFQGFCPNSWTFACVLKACGVLGACSKGQEIHTIIIEQGLLMKDLVLGNALVDMYAKCGHLSRAQEVFDILPKHDVVSWNALIGGYTQYGHCYKALQCFEQMKGCGYSPTDVTISCVLKACGSIGAADRGEAIHDLIVNDVVHQNVLIGTALVDMYSKCGALGKAEKVFNGLLVQNRVSWNALIAGYTLHGECEEAFYCFEKMQQAGFVPDESTYLCMLQACGNIGAADKGQQIYARMIMEGFLGENLVIGTALVDMYANCGMLIEAQEVFRRIRDHDVVSWSALIGGFAQLGEEDVVQQVLNKMILQDDKPDSAMVTIVLTACSHCGLLDIGEMFFEILSTGFGILPNLKHYSCMVDLYGRSGRLDKALTLISKMPVLNSLMVWHSLLGACKKGGDVDLGKLAFEHALELDEKDVLAYVCMRNIYASTGMKEDAQKVEEMGIRMEAWVLSE